MTIDLADYEAGEPYHGNYHKHLTRLQKKLEHLQDALVSTGARAVVMVEGWDAAGKDGIIQRLTGRWNPGHFRVVPIKAPTAEELAHDFLWRFRTRLPAPGNVTIFDRSWYGRVLVERVDALTPEAEWRAGYDAIAEFEDGLWRDGIVLVKLFVHVSADEQARRYRDRIVDPWKRWKTNAGDFHSRAMRPAYLEAMAEMFARTDRPGARWTVIDGNNKKAARIAALKAVAHTLRAHLSPTPPPLDPELAALAKRDLGLDPADLA